MRQLHEAFEDMSVTVEKEQCSTCRYFDGDTDLAEADGYCVRRPPVVIRTQEDDGQYWARTMFPVIYSETAKKTWCGEWEGEVD